MKSGCWLFIGRYSVISVLKELPACPGSPQARSSTLVYSYLLARSIGLGYSLPLARSFPIGFLSIPGSLSLIGFLPHLGSLEDRGFLLHPGSLPFSGLLVTTGSLLVFGFLDTSGSLVDNGLLYLLGSPVHHLPGSNIRIVPQLINCVGLCYRQPLGLPPHQPQAGKEQLYRLPHRHCIQVP
ncbi:hypothetical protein ES708_28369 [subsurface metagenome]